VLIAEQILCPKHHQKKNGRQFKTQDKVLKAQNAPEQEYRDPAKLFGNNVIKLKLAICQKYITYIPAKYMPPI
jgi:hypothetical protein